MKKILMIAALASLSTPAFASKARLNSLGNAEHLVDVQTAFNNPSHLLMLGDYATFETGPTSPTTYSTTNVPSNTAGAEGGFTRSHGDAKYGAYLGRKSDFTTAVRANMGFKGQENPVELQYAMKGAVNWGVALNISSSDTKSGATPQKQNAYGARFGAHTADWEAYGILGLGADATGGTAKALSATYTTVADADAKLAGTTGFKVGGSYKMENLYYFAKYYQDGAKYSSSLNAAADGLKLVQSQADVGVVDHMKMDGGEWFYGVSIRMFESNQNGAIAAFDSKVNTTSLPFLLGMEYDATTWMALRASVTQNVLLGSKKTQTSATDKTDTIENNTTVAAGIALKMNKWTLDGSWAAGTTGDVNTTALMTNAALTYNF